MFMIPKMFIFVTLHSFLEDMAAAEIMADASSSEMALRSSVWFLCNLTAFWFAGRPQDFYGTPQSPYVELNKQFDLRKKHKS